jgi:hypothetical protein
MRLLTIIHSLTYYFGNKSIASSLILGHLLKTDIEKSSFFGEAVNTNQLQTSALLMFGAHKTRQIAFHTLWLACPNS